MKGSKRQRRPRSFPTGRTRVLTITLLGYRTKIELVEKVELIDNATGRRAPIERYYQGDGNIAVPLGCTARYFETRADNNERVTDYGQFDEYQKGRRRQK